MIILCIGILGEVVLILINFGLRKQSQQGVCINWWWNEKRDMRSFLDDFVREIRGWIVVVVWGQNCDMIVLVIVARWLFCLIRGGQETQLFILLSCLYDNSNNYNDNNVFVHFRANFKSYARYDCLFSLLSIYIILNVHNFTLD